MVSTHLKNISQNGNLPQIGVKIKNLWNHHLVECFESFIFGGPDMVQQLRKAMLTLDWDMLIPSQFPGSIHRVLPCSYWILLTQNLTLFQNQLAIYPKLKAVQGWSRKVFEQPADSALESAPPTCPGWCCATLFVLTLLVPVDFPKR